MNKYEINYDGLKIGHEGLASIIGAAERYLNTEKNPTLDVLASLFGIHKNEEEETTIWRTEEEDAILAVLSSVSAINEKITNAGLFRNISLAVGFFDSRNEMTVWRWDKELGGGKNPTIICEVPLGEEYSLNKVVECMKQVHEFETEIDLRISCEEYGMEIDRALKGE